MLMSLSSLKSQFTNLCKPSVFKFTVLKFTIKIAIYKPMQILVFRICSFMNIQLLCMICFSTFSICVTTIIYFKFFQYPFQLNITSMYL